MKISHHIAHRSHSSPVEGSSPQVITHELHQAIVLELVQAGLLDELMPASAVGAGRTASIAGAAGHIDSASSAQQVGRVPGAPSQIGPSQVGRAQQVILAERERTEREKYTFTPKQRLETVAFNARREIKNAKLSNRAAAVELQMQQVATDPKLSPAKRTKKLRQLEKKHQKIAAQIKPPIVLEQVTAEVDAIASNDQLDQKQKKKKLEELRKRYGIPKDKGLFGKNGGVNMHDMFTGRLGKIYKGSKRRIDRSAKAHKQELRTNLDLIKQSHGKESIAYIRAKAELDGVDKTYGAESRRLKNTGDFLYDLYRPKGFFESMFGFFKKAFGWIGKIGNFIMPLVKLIPGVGQIAGAVWAGVKTVGNLVSGNIKGAVGSLLGALPGVGGIAGKVLSWVGKGYKMVKGGINSVRSLLRGDVAGALGSAASVAGGGGAAPVAKLLQHGANTAAGVQSLARGDVAGALQGAAGVASAAGGENVAQVLDSTSGVARTVQRVANGDVAGVVQGFTDELGGVDEELTRQLQHGISASARRLLR